MVRMIHHRLGHERRSANAFQRRDAACALLWTVHAARIELHNAVGVRQAAITDAVVFGIALHDVYACDERIEHVGAAGQESKGLFTARRGTAVLETVAVGRGDDDRPRASTDHGWTLAEKRMRG